MSAELYRKYNELALNLARKKKSDQTGFIHLYYSNKDDQPDQSIPVLENFLYVATLFRSKTAENIAEGKAHLDKLLAFHTEGGFPVYLHEFPQVKDRVLCFHVYALLHEILAEFQTILGSELKQKIEQAKSKLLLNCRASMADFQVPLMAQVRLAAAQKDHAVLEKLAQSPRYPSQADLGGILAALFSIYPTLSGTPWESFWKEVQSHWHPRTLSYVGEGKQDHQQGFEPQATLLDLVMGLIYGKGSKRSLSETPHLFQAAWLPLIKTEEAVSAAAPSIQMAESPFRCHWGTPERVHTLVCQGGNIRSKQVKRLDNGVEILFELDALPDTEDKEKLREIVFYLDYADTHAIRFNGHSSTTFHLQDPIEISSPPFKATLQFELVEGSGQWMGHLMRGNRPSQIAAKGANRFQSYDWQIILRTLRRTESCKILCRIVLECGDLAPL